MNRICVWIFLISLPSTAAAAEPFAEAEIFRTIVRKAGDDGVKSYRIPGLATSKTGTLLAVFDLRHKHAGDLPADVDVGLARSEDDGTTWSKTQVILDFDASEPGSAGNGVGDPSILVDPNTGHIFVAALWSRGRRAWAGSGPGLTPEETGQFILTKSEDDGRTWSPPLNITAQVKNPAWRLCFQGPGAGIATRDGTLIFPAQFKGADDVPHACFICSGDGGKTWKISSPAVPVNPPTSEAQIAETSDGGLLLSMRNEARTGKRLWARFDGSGEWPAGKWSEPWQDLPDPTCMASLIRHPRGLLLFANPADPKRRTNLTVRASRDDGKTWNAGRLLDARPAAYSCLAILKDGRVGILYEVEVLGSGSTLSFARIEVISLLAGDAPGPER